jgi:hypothetical protein
MPGRGRPPHDTFLSSLNAAIRSLVVGSAGTAYPLDVAGALKDLIEAPGIDAFRSLDPQALIDGLVAPLGPDAPAAGIVLAAVARPPGQIAG